MDGAGFVHCRAESWAADGDGHRELLLVVATGHPCRAAVEAFIAARYREAYGACVTEFMPTLFALLGSGGEILAAAGLRRGSEGPLFVEHYLDAPAEITLAALYGTTVDRHAVAEIGHLTGIGYGSGRRLFPLLARWLRDQGIEWALFAATGVLRGLFERMQIRPRALAPARSERLGTAAGQWGSYYDTDPWVVGGPLSLGQRLITP